MESRAVLGGRYELGPPLGSGGFGTVYRARDRQTNAEVAVKVVPRGLGADHIAHRLRREALALRRVASTHVARIVDFGDDDGGVYLVTELVAPAVSLSVEGIGRPLLPHEALRAARSLLDGLAAAHTAGIAHGDVKPENILVPRGPDALDALKIIDFGLARVTTRASLAEDAGDDLPRDGIVFGTAQWMAPEVLRGAEIDARSDLYSAGLVLFDLLGVGPLFPGESEKAQLRARLLADAAIDDRVPAPISIVLARLLARDPSRRYRDAREAHTTVCDLDTAPVAIITGGKIVSTSPPSSSLRPHSSTRPRSERAQRLTSLPPDATDGLRETLRRLDLPMLDALARRERGNVTGRIARAVALAMRLEIDAAALVLEPLASQSDIARGIGATILAPRARRVTRARVDADREDSWIETVPVELAALLTAVGAAIGRPDGVARDVERTNRVLARLERSASASDSARTTLRITNAAARVRSGELRAEAAMELVKPLLVDVRELPPLERVVRGLAVAEICAPVDEARAREELERAEKLAADSGTTLLDACAATALGKLIVSSATRLEQGIGVLERAGTLLAHGDAPSLEHEAEHHRAAALIVLGRFGDAVAHLRAAREAAHAERALELEVLSASLEVLAHLALGDRAEASEAAATLGAARIGNAKGRAAALAWAAKSLEALLKGETDPAEDALAEAEARAREADAPDAHVLVEVLGMLFDAARGALPDLDHPASELERFAQERGFTAFYWFDVLRAVIARIDDPKIRGTMEDVLTRLGTRLGPHSRLARERKTSAPPSAIL